MSKSRRPRSRADLQAAFVVALSPRRAADTEGVAAELARMEADLVEPSTMTATPILAGGTEVGTFFAGMSHEEFMAGMGWGQPAPAPAHTCCEQGRCNGCDEPVRGCMCDAHPHVVSFDSVPASV